MPRIFPPWPIGSIDRNPGSPILYLAPLRAMTRDLEKALHAPVDALGLEARVEARTGDTSSRLRARQRKQLPEVLLTTPESLSLFLTYPESRTLLGTVRTVIVDEWHELHVSKRGTQVELALARLRQWQPQLRIWALSATVANPAEAAAAAVGPGRPFTVVDRAPPRRLILDTVLPKDLVRQPWSGHYGMGMVPEVLKILDPARSTIVFTNTRAQAESWFDGLARAQPEWSTHMAIHHGSLDRDERERVEAGLKDGSLRLVVSTSSLDLGVDFSPVDEVVQIGSPKGVARVLQRGGRARHQPGVPESVLRCVPTHAFQAIEFSAAREAIARREIERALPPRQPLDVLCQHLVTVALGGGFEAEALRAEVRSTAAYQDLSDEQFQWCLDHIAFGGKTLRAYPEYHRIVQDEAGVWRTVEERRLGRQHRAMVGTIVSEGMLSVRFRNGQRIGQVEEYFVSKLHPGDVFLLAGRKLEFIRLRDMTVEVKNATRRKDFIPHYAGGRVPLTNQLSIALRREMDRAAQDDLHSPELRALAPLFAIQGELSAIPRFDELLVEVCESNEGYHCFVFPFAGRKVHDGLAALLAFRLARLHPATFTLTPNDYGFEMLCETAFPWRDYFSQDRLARTFSSENLLEDTLESINVSAMAKRQFRGIARVAGLVFEGYPHQRKTARQLQASSELIYEVFSRFDPENALLLQAQREVLEEQFEQERMEATLERCAGATLVYRESPRPSPLAQPLVADRLSSQVSGEKPWERVQRAKTARPRGRRRAR
jgi:ATP-dependent Lhr-like helicase